MDKINLGFLASHRGTNMQAIIDTCKQGALPANPAVVISNHLDSGALARARAEAIPAYHLSDKTHADLTALDAVIAATLKRHNVELVVLAGYMKKIGPVTLAAFPGRVINIHPGLLPEYGGQGMYGMRVHEAVVAGEEKESGVTIHVVDAEYDTGPILAQKKMAVMPDDTAATLAERILALEHSFYTETIGKIISGEIRLP